ncbi:MAG TPA: TIGR03619 family F420-dependent LLM class oxidoreductase [Solirubrobacteraceae bacterium]|nr:TIGR03619 family F420-dependent LLM class oxidoreductase [Solirubrobacteraceae bacterium]
MLVGAKLQNSGPLPLERGIPELARALEQGGADSIWVSDHVVLPREMNSHYPFAADGRANWASDTPYFEAMIALALAAAATERVRLGTAVLVLPLRNPVMFAKQAASIDAASGGRLELGLGAGWLAEEFEALNVPFARRGAQLSEWIAIARDCWTGFPSERRSEDYVLPADTLSLPTPAHRIPILLGGHSARALKRVGAIADGWLGQQSTAELDPRPIAEARATILEAAQRAGRDGERITTVLRIVESAGRPEIVAAALPLLAEAGVDEVIVDLTWEAEDQADQLAVLRAGAAAA